MEAPTFRRSSFCPPPVSESWSAEEVAATVADYMTMLEQELRGEPVNKAEHNRLLRSSLRGRSKGAVEFKHANISALMIELGLPYIDGYQPRGNYQALLRDEIVTQWDANPVLQVLAGQLVVAPAPVATTRFSLDTVFVPVPTRLVESGVVRERPARPAKPRLGINYLERDAQNAALGLAGEEFVLRLEHQRLWEAGAPRLADRVEHVARTQGDGLGYDIVSFEADGRERLIEVKTTSFGERTPFYASRREVEVSMEQAEHYKLYRLFTFRAAPRVFVLNGALDQSCLLEAVQYSARPA
jgi:hypothetical protein